MARQSIQMREFPGKRWIHIALRTLHAIGVILLGAALLSNTSLVLGSVVTLASGAAMLAIDTWSRPAHLAELSGFGVLLKLGLIALMDCLPGWSFALFWVVVIISMVLSHAPGTFRHQTVIKR